MHHIKEAGSLKNVWNWIFKAKSAVNLQGIRWDIITNILFIIKTILL